METTNNPEIKACPFCGAMPRLHDGDYVVNHASDCYITHITGNVSNHWLVRKRTEKWNVRAGDRQPAPPETVGVKALESVTCSAAAIESLERLAAANIYMSSHAMSRGDIGGSTTFKMEAARITTLIAEMGKQQNDGAKLRDGGQP